MVDRMLDLEEGTRLYLLAPIVRGRKGEYRKEFAELLKRGFQRVKVDGEFHELESPPTLNKKLKHDIEVVVDRLVMKEGLETRLADSIETVVGAEGLDGFVAIGGCDKNMPGCLMAMARLVGYALAGVDPSIMGIGPVMLHDDSFRFEIDLETGATVGKVFLSNRIAGPFMRCRLDITGTGMTPEGNGLADYSGKCRMMPNENPENRF